MPFPQGNPTAQSKMELISFARHLSSFMPGRVRVRHKLLRVPRLAEASRARLEAIDGVTSVEMNTVSGSMLIMYDVTKLDRDALIAHGISWARWLEAQA